MGYPWILSIGLIFGCIVVTWVLDRVTSYRPDPRKCHLDDDHSGVVESELPQAGA